MPGGWNLKSLCHPGIPAFVGEYDNGEMGVVLPSMSGRAAEQASVVKGAVLDIGAQLCDI